MSFMIIEMYPIAYVCCERDTLADDGWGDVESVIELSEEMPTESLDGLDDFSHLEIIYHLHLVGENEVLLGSEHPRENPDWPKVGIFAQRKKNRPNRLGLTIVELIKREGRRLTVKGLDAIDGTPILDIKPVMQEFLPRKALHQPDWVRDLMQDYW